MNQDIMQALQSSVHKVFDTMIHLPVKAGVPTSQVYPATLFDVSAVIGVTGDISGTITVQMKQKAALMITSAMLQTPANELSAEVGDAVGELGNMIAGSIKNEMSAKGMDFNISIPAVVTGAGHFIGTTTNAEAVLHPFFVQNEPMIVTICVKRT
jgi:chemotaxis protein CheX